MEGTASLQQVVPLVEGSLLLYQSLISFIVLPQLFVPKREEDGSWKKKLHNELNVFFTEYCQGD
jgi:hypothetical protein